MNYFNHVSSLADLKKQYRTLAVQHHPDKGGKVEIMQEINVEFEKLYKIWEHRQPEKTTAYTGYESDYSGATAEEYAEYVYNEYRHYGENYKGQSNADICDLIREWLKQTYPHYKFSVTNPYYSKITLTILKADFEPFVDKNMVHTNINIYHIETSRELTDRAKEVAKNIKAFVFSYNYDDSDIMTDYFNTNFYFGLNIGNSHRPFVYEPILLKGKKGKPVAKVPEGMAHKAVRLALGDATFDEYDTRKYGKIKVLGKYSYSDQGEKHFYPLSYGGRLTALKRIKKLTDAGIQSQYLSGMVQFLGYTPETEAALRYEDLQMGNKEKILV